jgi:hypothetical protein
MTVMIYIREKFGSNHGRGSDLPTEPIRGFRQSSWLDSSKRLKFGQGRFLSRRFQLIIF